MNAGARRAQNHPHFWIAAKCGPATPRGGNTGACAGKTITGNQVMYIKPRLSWH
jgi:hypothetical protein